MKNPRFDFSLMTLDELLLLRELPERFMMRTPIVGLLRRGMVERIDNHWNRLTPRGHWAKRGIFPGVRARVTSSHKHPWMHGQIGMVETVHSWGPTPLRRNDYGGMDWAAPSGCADLKFADRSGTYCFYSYDDLEVVYATSQPVAGFFPG